MNGVYKVVDRRGKKEERESQEIVRSAPASLYKEVQVQKITKEKLFVHPTPGRVIVAEDHFSYKGRIIVPDQSERRPTTGTILECGKGVENFVPGQKIVYGLYSGTVLEFKGWDPKTRIIFRVLGQDEILSWIDDKSPEFIGTGV